MAANIEVSVTIAGLDYNKIQSNPTLKRSIINKVAEKAAAQFDVDISKVTVVLRAGSVVAKITITATQSERAALQAKADTFGAASDGGTLATEVIDGVRKVQGIENALETGKTLKDLSATVKVDSTKAPSPAPSPSPSSTVRVGGGIGLLFVFAVAFLVHALAC